MVRLKTYFFLSIIYLLSGNIDGQSLNWIYKVGGINADYGSGVGVDTDQNIYDIVDFTGTASIGFNINYTAKGASDILLRKSTNLGIRQWVAQIGGKGVDNGYDLSFDATNNVYVTGTFKDTLFYNNTPLLSVNSFSNGVFIIKISPAGNVIWSRKFESLTFIQPTTITNIGNTEVLISGNFEGTAIFRSTSQPLSLTSKGSTDIFFLKINAVSGEPNFLRQIGGSGQELVNQHASDNAGNIFLAGEHRASFDADPSDSTHIIPNSGNLDGFLIKYNSDFQFTWAKDIGGSGIDNVRSIALDRSRNVIITGGFSSTVAFGTGSNLIKVSKGSIDIFLIKYSETGVPQWLNTFGNTENDQGSNVIVNRNDVIYLGGTFSEAVDFNPSIAFKNESVSFGGLDIFAAIYNQDGTYNSHFSYGGQANEQLANFALKTNGELISVGGFGAVVDFDPTSSSANIFANGGLDGFMVNFSVCVFPYLKTVFAVRPIVCLNDRAVIVVQEGYLNSATQWSWQRDSCNNITFASGDFIDLLATRNITYFVRGFGGCVNSDPCKKIDIKVFRDSIKYQNIKICQGDTLSVGNSRYTSPGTFVDSLASVSGCDSVIVSEISVFPKYFQTVSISICMGDTLKLGNSRYTLAGNYTKIFQSINGCDSTIVINLTVKPILIENVRINLCRGDSIRIRNIVYREGGTFIQTSKNTNGCDDLLIINIKLIQTKFNRSSTICEGEFIKIGNNNYFQSGTYLDSLKSVFSCDSIITTNLTVKPNASTTQEFDLCFGETVQVGSKTYGNVGIFRDTLINKLGCDSLITTFINNLTPQIIIDQSIKLCEGDSLKVGNKLYFLNGMYRDTLQSNRSCDSIVNTAITIIPKDYSFSFDLCQGTSFPFFDTTYTTSGQFTKRFVNSIGCDSIVTLNLSLKPVVTTSQKYTFCDGDTIRVAGKSYTEAGNYVDSLNTIFGCDSILKISIVKRVIEVPLDYTLCFNQTVVVNRKTYNKTGLFRDTIITQNKCDSILEINVKISEVLRKDTVFNICRGQSITVGSSVYANAGQFTEVIKNKQGCDSSVVFEIKIVDFVPIFSVSRDTLKTQSVLGASYQWFQCTPTGQRIMILGAVQATLAFPKSGLYALGVTYLGCTYFTDCIFVMLTATDDIGSELMEQVTVYPNPTDDLLFVNTSIPIDYKLLDLHGREVNNGTFLPIDNQRISLKELAPAIYILELKTNIMVKRIRIIKQ